MEEITNQNELRKAYDYVILLRKFIPTQNPMYIHTEILKRHLENEKRKIRQYNKRELADVLVKDYGIDGAIFLVEFPKEIDSYEAAKEYFDEEKYIPYYDRGYDCTGQKFTSWYRLVNRNGRWVAYHRIAVDV